jgi:hypothetical protein
MLKWLLRSLLVLFIFIPVAAAMPLAALVLSRTPGGAELVFWAGPWSAAFWVLIYSQISLVPWREGAAAVHQWRAEHGGLLVASMWATAWMFGALICSYIAEFLFIFTTRNFSWMPCATFSPIFFCWCWRKARG